MTPRESAASSRARLGVMVIAAFVSLPPPPDLPPLLFFGVRASISTMSAVRMLSGAASRTMLGLSTAATASGCAMGAGAGLAIARVAKKIVVAVENFIFELLGRLVYS